MRFPSSSPRAVARDASRLGKNRLRKIDLLFLRAQKSPSFLTERSQPGVFFTDHCLVGKVLAREAIRPRNQILCVDRESFKDRDPRKGCKDLLTAWESLPCVSCFTSLARSFHWSTLQWSPVLEQGVSVWNSLHLWSSIGAVFGFFFYLSDQEHFSPNCSENQLRRVLVDPVFLCLRGSECLNGLNHHFTCCSAFFVSSKVLSACAVTHS